MSLTKTMLENQYGWEQSFDIDYPSEAEMDALALDEEFSQLCASFPRIDAAGHINYLFDSAKLHDECIREIRRRLPRRAHWLDIQSAAERWMEAREMFNFDHSEPRSRFSL